MKEKAYNIIRINSHEENIIQTNCKIMGYEMTT